MADSSTQYPKRPPFFAMRVIRAMVKTCAAQEIGPVACLLVTVIATTEDAAGYRRPITWHNEQLAAILGIKKWRSLNRSRQAAIDAGWLVYVAPPSGSAQAGRYWATIPAHAQGLDDAPTDEGTPDPTPEAYAPKGYASPKAYAQKDHAQPEAYAQKGYAPDRAYALKGYGGGYAGGQPSSLSLFLTEKSSAPASAGCSPPATDDEGQEQDQDPEAEPIVFPVKGSPAVWTLPPAKLAEYVTTFAKVDVAAELLKARQWTRDNPGKRKTATGMPRFLSAWLSRAAEGHGGRLKITGDTKAAGDALRKRTAERVLAARREREGAQ